MSDFTRLINSNKMTTLVFKYLYYKRFIKIKWWIDFTKQIYNGTELLTKRISMQEAPRIGADFLFITSSCVL